MTIEEKLTKIAEDMPKVYEAGKTEGKQAEYDAFWDGFQDFGKRDSYAYAFVRYSDDIFYPKYDIKPTTAQLIFSRSKIANIKQRFAECGVALDFSNATSLVSAFEFCETTHLGIIDTRSATALDSCFNAAAKLIEIEKLILKPDGSQSISNMLVWCNALENLTIEGTIGQNGFDVQWSTKLSKTSITSIINALSTTTSSLTVTLSRTAVNNAFETSEGAADGSASEEWLALVATKSNWTIALA